MAKKTLAKRDVRAKEEQPARILFKELPEEKILIVGWENFLTGEEIAAKCGERVRAQYLQFDDVCCRVKIDMAGDRRLSCGGRLVVLGDVVDKKEFTAIISSLKRAGNLLHELVRIDRHENAKAIII